MGIKNFMEGERGELDWFVQDEELNDYAMGLLESVDAIVYGRVTYEMMANFWPHAPGNFANRTNELPKIIFTKTLKETPWGGWGNARPVSGDLVEEARKLKQQPGKAMVVYGSGSIVNELMKHGLVDEYRLIVNPVLLGAGKSIFNGLSDRLRMKLTKAQAFPSGAVALTYCPI